MASIKPNTILLNGDPIGFEGKAKASSSITPGLLIERFTDGTLRPHSTAGGVASMMIARETDISPGNIDTVYPDGENVPFWAMRKGDHFYGFIAAGEAAVTPSSFLESNGDGSFRNSNKGVATRASVTVGTGNAAVTFTADAPGSDGNDLTIQLIAGTSATQTQVVTGNAVVLKTNTTTPGTTDTATTVASNFNGDAIASKVMVAAAGGSGASAVVTPVAVTSLSGGVDTTGVPLTRATESVDNSAGGSRARLRMEVL